MVVIMNCLEKWCTVDGTVYLLLNSADTNYKKRCTPVGQLTLETPLLKVSEIAYLLPNPIYLGLGLPVIITTHKRFHCVMEGNVNSLSVV